MRGGREEMSLFYDQYFVRYDEGLTFDTHTCQRVRPSEYEIIRKKPHTILSPFLRYLQINEASLTVLGFIPDDALQHDARSRLARPEAIWIRDHAHVCRLYADVTLFRSL